MPIAEVDAGGNQLFMGDDQEATTAGARWGQQERRAAVGRRSDFGSLNFEPGWLLGHSGCLSCLPCAYRHTGRTGCEGWWLRAVPKAWSIAVFFGTRDVPRPATRPEQPPTPPFHRPSRCGLLSCDLQPTYTAARYPAKKCQKSKHRGNVKQAKAVGISAQLHTRPSTQQTLFILPSSFFVAFVLPSSSFPRTWHWS